MNIRPIAVACVSAFALTAAGCSTSFWGGAAGGPVGPGAAYEVHARSEIKRVEEDFKAGRIDQREYDIRKDQIKRDSLLQ